MIEERRDADELIEDVEDRAPLGRLANPSPRPIEVGLDRNRMHQQHAMPIQQPVELLTHRAERTGLNLDQQLPTPNVDHVALQRHLQLVARLRVALLEGSMQGPLVQGADAWLGSQTDAES